MQKLLTYHEIDQHQWQSLIERSPYATWFQTPEAYDFFASNPDEMTPFCYAIQRDGELRTLCVGYITKEPNSFKQYFTRRAIIIGGLVIAEQAIDQDVAQLLCALQKRLKGQAIYIETRNFHDYSKWKDIFAKCGFEYNAHLNFHVDTSSVEGAESRLGKNRKRDIKTSLRDGAIILENPTIEQVREYYNLLKQLYTTKIKTPLFSLNFFEKLYQHPNGRFILIEREGEIIGGTVCVELPNRCLYEWFVCGRDGEWKSIFPSSLATYAGIRYAAEHDCARFDMMGAGKPDEAYGVRDFKARFGGEQVEHGRYLCVQNKLLYKIGELGVKWYKSRKNRGGVEVVDYQNVSIEEWRKFVKRHPQGNIFQTPEMYQVYADTSHNQPIFLAVKKHGRIKGFLLAVVVTNGSKSASLLTARSIIHGAPLVVNSNPEILEILLQEYRKRLPWYVIYSEIRPIYNMENIRLQLMQSGFNRVGHYNIYLNVRKHETVLWNQMHKERRRNVQQAQKAGLTFREVTDKQSVEQIIGLIVQTYQRKRVPMSYEDIFLQTQTYMSDNVRYFAAFYGDKMLAGQVRLCYKNLVYAWFAGSDEQYFKLRPNDFLMWNVIAWAHKNGYKYFDFGGGGEPGVHYGVRDYKMKYGCQIDDYGRYICTHRPVTYWLGKSAIKLLKKN